jgi:hypothetical protein
MKKTILVLLAALMLAPGPVLAQALGEFHDNWALDDGAREDAPERSALDSGGLAEERGRLASDTEEIARDKEAVARDRSLYRWWLLNEDNDHLKEAQARLSRDYEIYARDSQSGPQIFDMPE